MFSSQPKPGPTKPTTATTTTTTGRHPQKADQPSTVLHLEFAHPPLSRLKTHSYIQPLIHNNQTLTLFRDHRIRRRRDNTPWPASSARTLVVIRECSTIRRRLQEQADNGNGGQEYILLPFSSEFIVLGEMARKAVTGSLVQVMDYWVSYDARFTNLQMEYCGGGDLASVLRKMGNYQPSRGLLPPAFTAHVALHLLLALVYLESGRVFDFGSLTFSDAPGHWVQIVHRAIMPRHVFFRYMQVGRDEFGWPEVCLGGFTHAIPVDLYYPDFQEVFDGVLKRVRGRWEPFVSDCTFDMEWKPSEEYMVPPECRGPQKRMMNRFTNAYQLGQTLFLLATGKAVPTKRVLNEQAQVVVMDNVEAAESEMMDLGHSAVMAQVVTQLLSQRRARRPTKDRLFEVIGAVLEARDNYPRSELPDWAFDDLPPDLKVSNGSSQVPQDHRPSSPVTRGREAVRRTSDSAKNGIREALRKASKSPVGQRIKRTLSGSRTRRPSWDFKDAGVDMDDIVW